MTDIASILSCYRSGQIAEDEMVDMCREWPELEAALKESSVTNPARAERVEAGGCAPPIVATLSRAERVQAAINAFNDREETEDFYGEKVPVRARKPILATDCDYEIVRISGVQGVRVQ